MIMSVNPLKVEREKKTMSNQKLNIEMSAVRSRLKAIEEHLQTLSDCVGEVLKLLGGTEHNTTSVSVYEALRQLVNFAEDIAGHQHLATGLQKLWWDRPDHPMCLARAALEAGRGKSVHYNGDKDGWIEWSGGERPVKENERVQVKFQDGHTGIIDRPQEIRWHTIGSVGDIIAYRVVKP